MKLINTKRLMWYSILVIMYFVITIVTLNTYCPIWYRIVCVTMVMVNFIALMVLSSTAELQQQRIRSRNRACFGSGTEEHY